MKTTMKTTNKPRGSGAAGGTARGSAQGRRPKSGKTDKMQLRVITLRYNESQQGFPEEALKAATFGRVGGGPATARQDGDGEGGEERRMNVGKWKCCQ
jgi:hypothetical protein